MASERKRSGNSRKREISDHPSADILDRQPPYNAQAEMAVLGSIFLKPDVADDVAMLLRKEDFYDDAHAKLYEVMMNMHDSGRKIDVALLYDELNRNGDLDRIGGAGYLAKIGEAVPTAAHVQHYAKLVQTDATSRALIDASTEILRDAYDPANNPRELLGQAEQKIFRHS